MRKIINCVSIKNHMFIFLSFCLNLIMFFVQIHAQTLSIQGRVTASRYRVKYASVTFIDNADTTKKFSTLTDDSGNYLIDITTSVEFYTNNLPAKFELAQNYPNPFSSVTAIPYNIHKHSDDIQVTIYDILGREVRKFAFGLQTAGSHNVIWDGRNNFGQKVTNGVYLYSLQVGSVSKVKKMVFNSGGKNFVSLSQINSSLKLDTGYGLNKNSEESNYSVRIENTDNTSPIIISKQFNNIQVNNDTTINFNVDYLTSATIDLDSVHQIIQGFGGANIVGWNPGSNYGDMTPAEVQTAFGTGDGQLGFTIMRLRISPDSTQFSMNIPSSKLAESLGAIVIASPWTPPPSMKTNNNVIGGELKENSYSDYAAYLKSFADYMAANDAPLYAISLQNEPDANVDYESCDWNATQFLNFCKNNAASIGYRIIMPESQNFVRALSDPTLNDSIAVANVSIIAGHIYGGGLSSYPLAEEKGKEVWMTEHLSGENYLDGVNDPGTNWYWSLEVAKEMSDVMKAGMSAYVWWWMVRFYGPISDGTNNSGSKGDVTKKGYVMSQFARFIRPGFYRVESKIYPAIVTASITAYKDPVSSKVVIVAINPSSNSEDVAFTFQNGTIDTFTPYTTSETKNVEQGDDILISDNKVIISLEASSITTFVSN